MITRKKIQTTDFGAKHPDCTFSQIIQLLSNDYFVNRKQAMFLRSYTIT